MQQPSEESMAKVTDLADPLAQASDAEIMRLCQQEPQQGIAALYDRYGRLVFSVALRIVGDRGVAEEVTQDVFVTCWKQAHQYEAERGDLLPWLLRIARNRAIDELRSRRHRQYQHELQLGNWDLLGRIADPEDRHLIQATVREALTDLPPAQREVIELLYFWGLTRQEAADHLQSPIGTIHTRLRLGMAKLRHRLGNLFDEK